ncbi:hypothetical protein QR680_008113 [Steinernema hermaphroditum]|uniref:RING-type E3 ubiquitin transferase n=1 Tax=Steinernema hermaphroditum TaxID=289476 RepID=A0AA39M7A1_9BILA|nr:hypothetical protein QR680_008113 [Steinernema hermaphroditum]
MYSTLPLLDLSFSLLKKESFSDLLLWSTESEGLLNAVAKMWIGLTMDQRAYFMDNFHSISLTAADTESIQSNTNKIVAEVMHVTESTLLSEDELFTDQEDQNECVLNCLPIIKSIDESTCTVCFDSIAEGERYGKLDCGHLFHPACISPWLRYHNTCPTCRHPSDISKWIRSWETIKDVVEQMKEKIERHVSAFGDLVVHVKTLIVEGRENT